MAFIPFRIAAKRGSVPSFSYNIKTQTVPGWFPASLRRTRELSSRASFFLSHSLAWLGAHFPLFYPNSHLSCVYSTVQNQRLSRLSTSGRTDAIDRLSVCFAGSWALYGPNLHQVSQPDFTSDVPDDSSEGDSIACRYKMRPCGSLHLWPIFSAGEDFESPSPQYNQEPWTLDHLHPIDNLVFRPLWWKYNC